MVGEKFENYLTEVAKMHLKSSTMVGENFEKYLTEVVKVHLKLSTLQPCTKYVLITEAKSYSGGGGLGIYNEAGI